MRLSRLLLHGHLAAAAALVLAFFLCFTALPAHDLWWQMKAGEVIAAARRVPRRDLFGWPSAGAPWVVHEWLADLALYAAYRHLPSWALVLYKSGAGAL